jgi:hypothetical protein
VTTDDRPTLTVKGARYSPTLEQVQAVVADIPGRRIRPGEHWVKVEGRKYPLKTVVGRTLGVPRASFTLPHAWTFCRVLGLECGRQPGDYER